MELRHLLTLVLVAGLLAPAAGASVVPQADRPQTVPQQSTAVATEAASSAQSTSG